MTVRACGMGSTALDAENATSRGSIGRCDKSAKDEMPPRYGTDLSGPLPHAASENSLKPIFDDTRRKLKPRHIQLIGIGGCVGMVPGLAEQN